MKERRAIIRTTSIGRPRTFLSDRSYSIAWMSRALASFAHEPGTEQWMVVRTNDMKEYLVLAPGIVGRSSTLEEATAYANLAL